MTTTGIYTVSTGGLSKENEAMEQDEENMGEDFCSSTTLHGLRHVYFSKGLRKLLWFVLFVGAIFLSCFLFYGQILDYSQYKVYQTTKDFDYRNDNIDFPTVTICNKVPLTKIGYERVNKIANMSVQQYEDFYLKYLTRYKFGETGITSFESKVLEKLAHHNITTVQGAMNLFAVNDEDMFHHPLSATFLHTNKGDPDYPTCRIDYTERCSLKETVSWREDLCYQINHFEHGKQSLKAWDKEKERFGHITAFVNIHSTDNIKRTRQVRKQAPYMDLIEGVVMYIHPFGMPHHVIDLYERIFIQPGSWHFIEVDYTEVNLLGPPYASKCGTKKYKTVNSTDRPYCKTMCLADCFLRQKMKECKCVGWEFAEVTDLPTCNITQMHCYMKARGGVQRNCEREHECPNDCKGVKYNIRVEQMHFKSEELVDNALRIPGWQLNSSETLRYIEKNLVGIQLSYTSKAKVETLQPAVTFGSLIGSIGGSIGLAMGFSVLTACEFVFFLTDFFKKHFRGKDKKDKKNSVVPAKNRVKGVINRSLTC